MTGSGYLQHAARAGARRPVPTDAPVRPPPRRPSVLAAAAVAGLAAYGALDVGGDLLDRIVDFGLHVGLMGVGALLCLARAVRFRAERAAWLLIGAATAASTVGDGVYSALYADDASPPAPNLADALWLAFLPLAGIGLALLVRARFPRPAAARWIEGLQAALLVAALGLMGIFYPVLESATGSAAAVVVNLAYPLGDIVVMGSILGVFALSGFRPGRSWLVLGAGFVVFSITDAIYSIQAITGTYTAGGLLDAGWPAAHLLIAYAAWMPWSPVRRVRSDDWRTVVLPATVWLIGILIQVGSLVGVFTGGYRAPRLFLIAAQILVLLKIADAPLSARRLLCEDSLTRLGNRRALARDVRATLRRRRRARLLLFVIHGLGRLAREHGLRTRDELLIRIGRRVAEDVGDAARVYRLEEGEFCLLAPLDRSPGDRALVAAFEAALADEGRGLELSSASVAVPDEAATADDALAAADAGLRYGMPAASR